MKTNEALTQREPFFTTMELEESPTTCGDDRPNVLGGVQLGFFGGPAANMAASLMVLQEAAQPGSVSQPFAEASGSIAPILAKQGIKICVHSDQKTEAGDQFVLDAEPSNDIGCAYAKLRQAIFKLAGEKPAEITSKLTELKPHFYSSPEGQARLERFLPIFAKLGAKDNLFTTGRDVARSVKKAVPEADLPVLAGEHVSNTGILDDIENSVFDTKAAFDAELPAYVHESWAAQKAFGKIHDQFPYDELDFEAVNDIDTVATMMALGLEEITYRG